MDVTVSPRIIWCLVISQRTVLGKCKVRARHNKAKSDDGSDSVNILDILHKNNMNFIYFSSSKMTQLSLFGLPKLAGGSLFGTLSTWDTGHNRFPATKTGCSASALKIPLTMCGSLTKFTSSVNCC